jgi:hypothetical protein
MLYNYLPLMIALVSLPTVTPSVMAAEVNIRANPNPALMGKINRYRAFGNRLAAGSDSTRGSDSAWGQYTQDDTYGGAPLIGNGSQAIGCVAQVGGRTPRECAVIADDIININTNY